MTFSHLLALRKQVFLMETDTAKDILYLIAIIAFFVFTFAAFEFMITYLADKAPEPRVKYERYSPTY